ncbi:MAG: 50S ribosomal protein L29 [Candidatus Bathyarchaeota archaeon B24]|nr:MAG: 50S ribosomal protein L29 [Candidatus Bathyarchaeota archaeon B24]RLI26296.1 MAG: 50S ribosomal protein L29 [Candidatus Bathyarchaeota archaeon]
MPILRMREIRAMSPEERIRRVIELRMELMRLRATVKAGGAVENYARIREIKRTIARILTVQREEELKLERGGSK